MRVSNAHFFDDQPESTILVRGLGEYDRRFMIQPLEHDSALLYPKLGHLLAMSAGLGKTPIQPTQPYNVDLCWHVTYSCASKLHNYTNRLGRFLVS